MKHFSTFLFIFSLLLVSCEGDQGPPGPPGFDGQDGINIVGQSFEIEIDFTAANGFEFIEPYGFEVLPSDVTLVYLLWEVDGNLDIWRLCPQNVFFNDGILTYNFDFTQSDVRFFLDGTVDLDFLDPVWTQGQIFRVVVVPADNVDGIDVSDINNVLSQDGAREIEVR
jgi:hypothetical protein